MSEEKIIEEKLLEKVSSKMRLEKHCKHVKEDSGCHECIRTICRIGYLEEAYQIGLEKGKELVLKNHDCNDFASPLDKISELEKQIEQLKKELGK